MASNHSSSRAASDDDDEVTDSELLVSNLTLMMMNWQPKITPPNKMTNVVLLVQSDLVTANLV